MPHRRRRKHKQKVEDDEYRERDTADAGHANNPRPLSYVTAIVLLCYIAFFLLQRTASNKETVRDASYDLLFLCNFSLLIGAIGFLIGNTLFIGVSMACCSFSHAAYVYDVVMWLLFDMFPMGRVNFMEEFDMGSLWWTTMHQIWYIPLCFVVLFCEYRGTGVPTISWLYMAVINSLFLVLSKLHFSTAAGFAPSFGIGHEYMQDDYIDFIHGSDNTSLLWFIVWRSVIESGLLNGVFFIFLKAFSYLLLERDYLKLKEKQK